MDFPEPRTGPTVRFGEIAEPEPEPGRTVLTVRFGVRKGENQNRTEKPVISESCIGSGSQVRELDLKEVEGAQGGNNSSVSDRSSVDRSRTGPGGG